MNFNLFYCNHIVIKLNLIGNWIQEYKKLKKKIDNFIKYKNFTSLFFFNICPFHVFRYCVLVSRSFRGVGVFFTIIIFIYIHFKMCISSYAGHY